MALEDIVSVSIVVQDRTPTQAGFGTIMAFTYRDAFPGVHVYDANPGGLTALTTDGYATTSPTYKIGSRIVSQSPRAPQFKVYSRTTENQQEIQWTPLVLTEGAVYFFEVSDGGTFTEITYTVPNGASVASIVTAVQLLVNAVSGVTAADDTTHMTLTPTTAGTRVYMRSNDPSMADVKDVSADAGIATDLAQALIDDPDFYGVVLDSNCEAEINAAAAWCEANKKIFLGVCSDTDILSASTTDAASDLFNAGYHYSAVFYSADAGAYPNAGLLARQFSRDPGSSTWAFKDVAGVFPDVLTATQLTNARGKNALTFVSTNGIRHTFDGKAASGRFLDITRGIDWLAARMAEDIFAVIANLEKVPFTTAGIALVESVMRGRLQIAQDVNQLIDAGWTVTPPLLSSISQVDRANRLLPNMQFTARLAGAIHKVVIDGTVTV